MVSGDRLPFTVTIPVQFRDIDCMGHVNNAVYISYMEQVRVAFCGQFPEIDFRNPQNRTGKGLILARISCDFKRPVELGEIVEVSVVVPRVGNSSFDMHYELRLATTTTIFATGIDTPMTIGRYRHFLPGAHLIFLVSVFFFRCVFNSLLMSKRSCFRPAARLDSKSSLRPTKCMVVLP